MVKGPLTCSKGKMQQYIVGAPFEKIAVDIAGPFLQTDKGKKFVMAMMDYFTKWQEALPLPNQEALTVATALVKDWICRYGVPLEIHSDQGTNFESRLFQELCKYLKKTMTISLHP